MIGYQTGQTIRIKTFNAQDVLAAVYHVLGMDRSHVFADHNDRPEYLLDNGEKIEALI